MTKSLEQAIDQNDFLSVKSLSTEVSSLPSRDTGFILRAAQNGKLECLKALVDTLGTEKDLNFRSRTGKVALHYIAENGNVEMAQLMIQMGADVNAETESPIRKDTPLTIAASCDHFSNSKIIF